MNRDNPELVPQPSTSAASEDQYRTAAFVEWYKLVSSAGLNEVFGDTRVSVVTVDSAAGSGKSTGMRRLLRALEKYASASTAGEGNPDRGAYITLCLEAGSRMDRETYVLGVPPSWESDALPAGLLRDSMYEITEGGFGGSDSGRPTNVRVRFVGFPPSPPFAWQEPDDAAMGAAASCDFFLPWRRTTGGLLAYQLWSDSEQDQERAKRPAADAAESVGEDADPLVVLRAVHASRYLNEIAELRAMDRAVRQGKTQVEIGKALGWSQPSVHRALRRLNADPSLIERRPKEVVAEAVAGLVDRVVMLAELTAMDLGSTQMSEDPYAEVAMPAPWAEVVEAWEEGWLSDYEYDQLARA